MESLAALYNNSQYTAQLCAALNQRRSARSESDIFFVFLPRCRQGKVPGCLLKTKHNQRCNTVQYNDV